MNQADICFKETANYILQNGHKKSDRTGVGTLSIFGTQYKFQVNDYFPLLSLRKMHIKSVIYELLWFLGAYDEKYKKFGNTNLKFLIDSGVSFWNDWPYKEYNNKREFRPELEKLTMKEFEEKIKTNEEFALEFGDLGPIYGKQWLNWGGYTEEKIIKRGDLQKAIKLKEKDNSEKGESGPIDNYLEKDIVQITKHEGINQIDKIIEQLKKDPDSRRIIIETWNVSELDKMLLVPCHKTVIFNSYRMTDKVRYYEFKKWADENKINIDGMNLNDATSKFNFPTRKLSLQFQIRSQDFALGFPYNVAEYTILLYMIAQVVNMLPDEVTWTGGDVHLYNNSIEQVKTLMERSSKSSPKLKLNRDIKCIYDFREKDIEIIGYESHPNIKIDVAV